VPTAVLVYLHVSGTGALLGSGFWLMVSEAFDPRTAKRRFGHIAGAGTLGGLVGGLVAERVGAAAGVPAMLLFLAGFQFLTAFLVGLLTPRTSGVAAAPALAEPRPAHARSGLQVIAEAPHLHHLAALVLFGTTSAALLEFLFKARAVETFGPGDNLLRFFALYYAGTAVITLVLQAVSSRHMLERFGLGLTSSAPSIAVLTGSIAGLLIPGFGSLLAARASETVFRGSWFRAGYELFYTPLPAAERRAAKSTIDVGIDRAGDALGGGLVRLVMLFAPAAQSSTILSLAILSSIGAIVAATRLNGWYVRTLEHSLVRRGGSIDRTEMADDSMRRRLAGIGPERSRRHLHLVDTAAATTSVSTRRTREAARPTGLDQEMQDLLALRSPDRRRAVEVLSRDGSLPGALVHHAIPLLGVDALTNHATFALCKVAEEHVGELADAMVDPNRDPAIRRRLARVFSVCVSQRATDALLAALDDVRLDVRVQAARSLAAIRAKNPRVTIDRDRIHGVVLREAASDDSLAHLFMLLSLVLPREPLRIAFRSLQSDDPHLRGTALEYLEGVLPPPIRQQIWPLLLASREWRRAAPRERHMAAAPRLDTSRPARAPGSERGGNPVAGFGTV
jgi:hypothetical protein